MKQMKQMRRGDWLKLLETQPTLIGYFERCWERKQEGCHMPSYEHSAAEAFQFVQQRRAA